MNEIRFGYFLMAALLLLANAFFVTAEFALVGLRRTRIEELLRQGSRTAGHVKQLVAALDECLSTCQVGITLASLGLGWIGERTFAATFESLFAWVGLAEPLGSQESVAATLTAHSIAVPLAFLLVTFLHVVVGELAPKSLALQFPETLALWIAWPMRFFNRLFWPLVWLLNGASWGILKAFGLKPRPAHSRAHSAEELGMILDESRSAGVLSPDERKMLARVFRFHDKTVREIMVPRPDMVALDVHTSEEGAIKAVFESGYSRLPVYDGTLDKIMGIVYVKDLLYTQQHPKLIKVVDLLREAQEVPGTCPISQLLRDFQKRRVHMAIVVDEFGATSGLVTLEDIIEEIVGEIRDEHDQEPEEIQRLPDGTVQILCMAHLDHLREVLPEMALT
jgi:CBS domain containing-hemolysin-like protein